MKIRERTYQNEDRLTDVLSLDPDYIYMLNLIHRSCYRGFR